MRILLLSPHTDDAELGCGGSIARFKEAGNEICWAVFSIAEDALPDDMPEDTLRREFLEVTNGLRIHSENVIIKGFEVRNLHRHRQDILDELIRIRGEFVPNIVIGPSVHDYHQDHQIVANEMIRAFKRDASIICYELPWNHVTFDTQFFMRLERRHIEKKCEMLRSYRSQIVQDRAYFSEEFIFGLAKARGVQCNSEYAESFEVVRWMQ
jgi:LmbE family N-acetylglucosaminyl deacetylase